MQIWSALMDEINVGFEGKGKSNSGSLLHRGDQEPISLHQVAIKSVAALS